MIISFTGSADARPAGLRRALAEQLLQSLAGYRHVSKHGLLERGRLCAQVIARERLFAPSTGSGVRENTAFGSGCQISANSSSIDRSGPTIKPSAETPAISWITFGTRVPPRLWRPSTGMTRRTLDTHRSRLA